MFSSLLGIFTTLGLHEDQQEHFEILSLSFEALGRDLIKIEPLEA